MTPARLEQLLLLRGTHPNGPTARGLRLVLCEGWKPTPAAREVGITLPSLSRSVRRIKRLDGETK